MNRTLLPGIEAQLRAGHRDLRAILSAHNARTEVSRNRHAGRRNVQPSMIYDALVSIEESLKQEKRQCH
jgi:hypothetical protein